MKKYFAMFAFLLMATGAFAQVEGSSVYLGIAMPRRAYGAGLSTGYKYQYNLPVEGLGLIGSVDLYYTRQNKDIRNANEDAFATWLKVNNYAADNVTAKRFSSNHIALPINFGANYSYPLGRMNVWGEAGIGCAPIFTSRQAWKAKKYSSVEYPPLAVPFDEPPFDEPFWFSSKYNLISLPIGSINILDITAPLTVTFVSVTSMVTGAVGAPALSVKP
jgi:hypothetical protein